jgi:trehalose synthase
MAPVAGASHGTAHARLVEIPLGERPFGLIEGDITPGARDALDVTRSQARTLFEGRTVWQLNSTARGGGVAEMARALLPYWRGDGIDTRWLVLEAPRGYFRFTKRIHNLLHGVSQRAPGLRDADMFERVARAAAATAVEMIRPGDVVVLHDPQTAGLVEACRRTGAAVIWRCHVGADHPSPESEAAWAFLLPHIAAADRLVFTRRAYVPEAIDPDRVRLLAPAIDPCSPKNQPLEPAVAAAILATAGLAAADGKAQPVTVPLMEDHPATVARECSVLREGPLPSPGEERLVLSLTRWDRLKDPVGVMAAFVDGVDDPDARLVVAGPAVAAVSDDPEGAHVLAEVRAAWSGLEEFERRRVVVAVLPMDDLDENALIVNSLQRQAAVIVKKSVQEGFGLGVTEAMWKSKPVVATRVGGHQDQIDDEETGFLVDDSAAFAGTVARVLRNPAHGITVGLAGRTHVRDHYLADLHLEGWVSVLSEVLGEPPPRP